MTITLATAQADLLSLLGNDSALYPAATTAEALRQALADLAQDGPHQSAIVTVPSTGATLSLAALTDLLCLTAVIYPYVAGIDWRTAPPVFWSLTDPATLLLQDGSWFTAGEKALLLYQRTHTVNGLDGAVTTTVPDNWKPTLLTAAAKHATALRLRQLAESPRARETAAYQTLRTLHNEHAAAYTRRIAAITQRTNPSWGAIGL